MKNGSIGARESGDGENKAVEELRSPKSVSAGKAGVRLNIILVFPV